MVGQVGVDPTAPEGNGFTVRRVCRFATDPYGARGELRTLNPLLAWGLKSHVYTNSTTRAYVVLDFGFEPKSHRHWYLRPACLPISPIEQAL